MTDSEWLLTEVQRQFPAAKLDIHRGRNDFYIADINLNNVWCVVEFGGASKSYGVGKVRKDEHLFSAYDREHWTAQDALKHIEEILTSKDAK